MTKALISVTGLDSTGIIACVATKLSEMNINILDITQTILGGYFTMLMVVDLDGAHLRFEEIDRELQPVREKLGMEAVGDTEFSKTDGSRTYPAKYYRRDLTES